MKKKKIISKNAKELAEAMGLEASDALQWELRYSIIHRIVDSFRRTQITISELAKRSKTSRARITRILKGDTLGISLEVLLHVLSALGQGIKITYNKAA